MKAKKFGIIGKKLGMTQIYEEGAQIGVTVVDFSDMQVLGYRTVEKDGYSAVILGYDFRTVKRGDKESSRPRYRKEIRLDNTSAYENLNEVLSSAKKVDVSGIMKGRGFAGVMKRWHFAGGPATHGSRRHRSPGSAGQGACPGRVFKGKKMPGHMGNTQVTTLSQKLVRFDAEKKLLFVAGSIPGPRNGYVMVRDAVKSAI